jgi:hypothetical protein
MTPMFRTATAARKWLFVARDKARQRVKSKAVRWFDASGGVTPSGDDSDSNGAGPPADNNGSKTNKGIGSICERQERG